MTDTMNLDLETAVLVATYDRPSTATEITARIRPPVPQPDVVMALWRHGYAGRVEAGAFEGTTEAPLRQCERHWTLTDAGRTAMHRAMQDPGPTLDSPATVGDGTDTKDPSDAEPRRPVRPVAVHHRPGPRRLARHRHR